MRQILTMIRKEFKQVFRDKPMLAIIFFVPIVQLLVLSFAITTEVKHIKLLVADLDNSSISREVVRSFRHTDRFDFVGFTTDLTQIRDKFQAWDAQMVLIIPANFSKDIQRDLSLQLQLSVDGVDGNTAGIALGYASGILTQLGMNINTQPVKRIQLRDLHLVVMEERMWYNLDLSSKQYMVPGIAVVLLTILPMMLSSMSLVKEKEIGTLEQLMVTPLRKYQLLVGKLIPFLILSFVELAVLVLVSVIVFHITMNGSYVLLAFLAFLYLFTTLGLGILISTLSQSQQQAMFLSWFFIVFMIIMSGFFIPIENMPIILQKITYLNPVRYFMYIVRDIFQKGSPLIYLLKDTIPMTVFGLVIFIFSIFKFRKRVT